MGKGEIIFSVWIAIWVGIGIGFGEINAIILSLLGGLVYFAGYFSFIFVKRKKSETNNERKDLGDMKAQEARILQ